MNITVYLGANPGNHIKFKNAIEELGSFIGKRGDTLIYGGSKSGLMGILADRVLAANGKVIGVEPQMFIDQQVQHDSISELIITKNMSERKAKMIELGDAFIAFPGGTGTLEEMTEIMSLVSLKQIGSPCILYNLDGYYDGLKDLLNTMIDFELSSESRQKGVYFASSLSDIEKILFTHK